MHVVVAGVARRPRGRGVEDAATWWPGGDPEIYGGLVRDRDEGYSKAHRDRRAARCGLASAGLRAGALVGPALDGLPAHEEGFIVTGDDGDAVVSPLKFGGLATHQARRAAAGIARAAGVDDAPDPDEPVIHGRLLLGHGTPGSAVAATPRARRSGGRRARSRASTSRAG